MRSLLFVPGDSEKKQAKALESGADVIILDLEDSVAPAAKDRARAVTRAFLDAHRASARRPRLMVRVNALDTGLTDLDLDMVMAGAPDLVMLPKARGGADVGQLAARIAVREAEFGLADGATGIVPVATETATAIFGLGSYGGCSHRLAGLTWGAEDLSADIGAEDNRAGGTFTEPFRLARNMMLFAAVAAGVPAIDTVFVDFRDIDGLAAECEAARRDGFTAKMAIHPAQVAPINAAFTPSAAEVERARRIVDYFAANPQAGVVGIDGAMIDRPHLLRAERLLERAKAAGRTPAA